jgi:hypothetical protein
LQKQEQRQEQQQGQAMHPAHVLPPPLLLLHGVLS